jgi:MFS transporter, NNP family, nitrate/nitrite transporter
MIRSALTALRSGHWPTLIGAWLHFEISFMAWLLIGALGIAISDEFQLTATQKGVLVAVPLLGGALLRIVVGLCADRYGPKSTGLVILVCQFVTMLWGWLGATSYLEVLGVGILLGAAGASFAVALPLASRAYPPDHQGLAMGVTAAGNSGTVLVAFFAPRLAQIVGWHGVFGLMALAIIVTMVLYIGLVQGDHSSRQRAHGLGWWRVTANALRQPSMYWLCLVYAVTFGGFVGFASFLPIFFHDQYGLNIVAAGSITALCGLSGSAIRPVGGYLADRVGGLRMLGLICPVLLLLIILIAQLPSFRWTALLMVMALGAMGFGNGVVFQLVSERFLNQIGMASGLVGAAGGLGGFMLPIWLGLFKDVTGTYRTGFLLFAGVVVVVWCSVLVVQQRRRVGSPVKGRDGLRH